MASLDEYEYDVIGPESFHNSDDTDITLHDAIESLPEEQNDDTFDDTKFTTKDTNKYESDFGLYKSTTVTQEQINQEDPVTCVQNKYGYENPIFDTNIGWEECDNGESTISFDFTFGN